MDLDHIGDHFTAHKAVIDAVGPLALAVADIRAEIPGSVASGLFHALSYLFHQDIQVAAARMAVSKGALDHYLGLGKILRLPARTDT